MARSVIDLSLKIENGMPVYPGDMPVTVEDFHTIENHGSNTTKLVLGTHAGTHMDAPWHMLANGNKLDEIPLDHCMGPAVLMDLSDKGQGDSIDIIDLKRYERYVSDGARILLRTDWSRRFDNESYYENWPALTEEASRWLVERGIWLLGMETPSVDRRGTHINHEILLKADIVLVEGLANLSALRSLQVFFTALPLSLPGRDGSPVRAAAMEDDAGLPNLKELALAESLQDAKPYSPSLALGAPPVKGIPTGKHYFKS